MPVSYKTNNGEACTYSICISVSGKTFITLERSVVLAAVTCDYRLILFSCGKCHVPYKESALLVSLCLTIISHLVSSAYPDKGIELS